MCNTHQQPEELFYISILKQYNSKISYHYELLDFIAPHLPHQAKGA
jgi:hypothetical protein